MTDEQKQRSDGAHPNSLAASDDPIIARKIREGRIRFEADQRAFETWAEQGFGPAMQEETDAGGV